MSFQEPANDEEAPPPKPPRPMSPMAQAEATLIEAFPDTDPKVVKAILVASGGKVEPAFNALLSTHTCRAGEDQADGSKACPTPTSRKKKSHLRSRPVPLSPAHRWSRTSCMRASWPPTSSPLPAGDSRSTVATNRRRIANTASLMVSSAVFSARVRVHTDGSRRPACYSREHKEGLPRDPVEGQQLGHWFHEEAGWRG